MDLTIFYSTPFLFLKRVLLLDVEIKRYKGHISGIQEAPVYQLDEKTWRVTPVFYTD